MRLPTSIRLNLLLVVLASILPVLLVVVISGLDRRKHEIIDARLTTRNLVEYFAAQQEHETRRLHTILDGLAKHTAVQHLDAPACDTLFRHVLAANPHYVNFALLDSRGWAVASALPFTSQNLSTRKEVANALASGGFSVGEYAIGRISGEQILPFALAVKDLQGTICGVLLATQRLQDVAELFVLSALPEGSFMGLADNKGLRLYRHPPHDSSPLGVPVARNVLEKILESGEISYLGLIRK